MNNGRSWEDRLRLFVAIPAAVGALITLLTLLVNTIRISNEVNALLKTAEDYQKLDQFASAVQKLDKALELRPKDGAIEIKKLEVQTFQIATQYDQIKLVKDKRVLGELEDNCKLLANKVGRTARILALCGIVKELQDRPTEAIEEYYTPAAKDPSYAANVYNYWGYTIFKWEFGGEDWPTSALELFSNASKLHPDYVWPHANAAVVYLVRGNLPKAKPELEICTRLTPMNPRVQNLWGQYYLMLGEKQKAHNLPEKQQSFDAAIDHFQKAKDINPTIPDIRVNLGLAYEAVGRGDDAEYEFREATKLDSWNIQSCDGLARAFARRHAMATAQSEAARCRRLAADIVADYSHRLRETTDPAAREWLQRQIEAYKPSAPIRAGQKKK